jgi:AcrR family transcriptional regulator
MRERQKAQTRQLLHEAAVDLFSTKGYAQTTIDDITSAAGASRATFYLHYGAKWQIVAELYETVLMPETLDFYRRLDGFDGPSREELRGWLVEAFDFFERHQAALRFSEEARAADPELERMTPELLGRCADAMPRYLSRWSGPERDQARLRLELLIMQITRFCGLWIAGHWPVDRDSAMAVMLDVWAHSLRIE